MATKNTTFKLTDKDLERIEAAATELGVSRTEAIRIVFRDWMAGRSAVSRENGRKFLETLAAKFPSEYSSVLTVELDDSYDAFAAIDGERRDDVYVPAMGVTMRDGQGYEEDFVRVYLADPDSDFRLLLGLLPLRAGAQLSVAAKELTIDMRPRPVAYFVETSAFEDAESDKPARLLDADAAAELLAAADQPPEQKRGE